MVSVIIPVRNRPALLTDAVHSVLAQTYRPVEILIIDDSTDETVVVARAFAHAHPGTITVLPQDGRGIGAARNIGVRASRGEFIQFLDSDDVIMPAKFATQVAALTARPGCGISYCATREYRMGEAWSGHPARRSGVAFDYLFPALLEGRIWPAPSPLYRRSVVEAVGPFSLLSIFEDWEFESRAGGLRVRLHHCAEVLADKRDVHHREGRRKGGVPRRQSNEYAEVLLRLQSDALAAGVDAPALERFTGTLFAAARLCAVSDREGDARRLIAVALPHAPAPFTRAAYRTYCAASDAVGWRVVAEWTEKALGTTRRATARPVASYRRWRHRAQAARRITAGKPVSEWPELLRYSWIHRQSRRKA